MSRTVTITFEDDEWRELEEFWDYWSDESFALHAAYFFRNALIRSGEFKEEE